MATVPNLDELDCPACGGKIQLAEAARAEWLDCPNCGKRWRVDVQDVPGRALVDLKPLQA